MEDLDIVSVVARGIRRSADSLGLGREVQDPRREHREWLTMFDDLVTEEPVRTASRLLFADGHYARSVEEAFKCLNNEVKHESGVSNADGASLMRTAFSANCPILRLNRFQTDSEKDEQRGYMDIFAGSMTGIRNPRAHEHLLTDEPEVAFELLVLANHLMRKLRATTRAASP